MKEIMEKQTRQVTSDNTHAGRILALSRNIFNFYYRAETHRLLGRIDTFDNRCASDLQNPASVLELAGYTEYIDDIGRRSVFVCEPDDFEALAHGDKAKGVDAELVKEAVIGLAESDYYYSTEEIEALAEALKEADKLMAGLGK